MQRKPTPAAITESNEGDNQQAPASLNLASPSGQSFFHKKRRLSDGPVYFDHDQLYLQERYLSGDISIKSYLLFLNLKEPEFSPQATNKSIEEMLDEVASHESLANAAVQACVNLMNEFNELKTTLANPVLCDKVRASGIAVFCNKWNISSPTESNQHRLGSRF